MAETTVLKMSRAEMGGEYWGVEGRDDGYDHKVVLGQLYELDSGGLVVAARKKDMTVERFGENDTVPWRMWSLPDYAPESKNDMSRNYRDDWFDEDGNVRGDPNEVYLFWSAAGLDQKTHKPEEWGGQPLVTHTTEDDPRIVQVLADGVVVVLLKDVPENVNRSGSWLSLRDAANASQESDWIGLYAGPKSDAAAPTYFTKIRLADLPAATRPKAQAELPLPAQYKHGNSGRLYTFEAGVNSFTRELGWRPLDLVGDGKTGPAFDPVAPVMAVHDLMEHFPGDEYEPHNEYMAQGAMLWLRFEGGFFGSGNVADAVIKPAFGMLFHHIDKGRLETKQISQVLSEAERAAVLNHGMPSGTFFALNEIIFKAKPFIDSNYSYGDQKTRLHKSLIAGVPWIQHGYQRAALRYNGLIKSKLVALYRNTVEQISKVQPGAKLRLTMNYGEYTSKVEIEAVITA